MKKIMTCILLCFDLMLSFAQYGTVVYNIPAAGQTVTVPAQYLNNSFIALQTDGAVNLGSNTYTLTYAALPPNGFSWRVKMDFRRLTQSASGANVTIFGVKPLQAHPTVDTFDITYSVIPDSVGTKYLYYVYNGLYDIGKFNAATVFNGDVTFNDRTFFNGRNYINDTTTFYGANIRLAPVSAIATGQGLTAADTTGKITWGCAPWCVTGNSGLSSVSNFLGMTDTVSLRFRVNNTASGIIDYNRSNTSLGYSSLIANTTGQYNSAIGATSLQSNTTGASNSAFGASALAAITTGQENVGVGATAGATITTASNNVGVGSGTLIPLTTGHDNTAIGHSATVSSTGTNYAISIGSGASAASNQFVANGVRLFSLPSMSSGVGYGLIDSSGNGDFKAQALPQNQQTYYTPVTGDSVSVSTSANLINPSGTIANFTVRLPASPYSGQLLEFSTTQTITTLHWSTALSGDVDAVESHVPTTLSAGGTIKIMFNSDLLKWCNW